MSNQSPFGRATYALEECIATVEAVEDADIATRMQKEQEAVEDLAKTLAECYSDGMDQPTGVFAEEIANSTRLNKSEFKGLVTRKTQETESGDGPPLNQWVAENLEEVRVIRTTDHIQDSRYVWDFKNLTVETGSGDQNRAHFGWPNFRDLIYESGGPYLDDPRPELRDGSEWRKWIVRQEKANGIEKVSTGPRTNAVEYLKKRVRRADGYGNLKDAADMQGVYVEISDDLPEDADPIDTDAPEQECPLWRVGLLMVPNEWPQSAADEFGVSVRALQNELDARDYTIEGNTSVSSQEWIDGRNETFWTLNGDFAAPAAYQPEATTPDANTEDTDAATNGKKESDFGAVGGGD